MEFKEKEFDGPYEVCGIEIYCEDEKFKGGLYYPPETFSKPYPVIIYFHGFPELCTLQENVKQHSFLLDKGYAFITFNFRGHRPSQGTLSINSQVNDTLKVMDFIEKLHHHQILDRENVNLVAHDFGAYIALILCSILKNINRVLLLSPIINPKRHVESENFPKVLQYLNRFLPGVVKGVEDPQKFIERAKKELNQKSFQIENVVSNLHCSLLKILVGVHDDIANVSEIEAIFKSSNIKPLIETVEDMEHECIDYEEFMELKEKVLEFFF